MGGRGGRVDGDPRGLVAGRAHASRALREGIRGVGLGWARAPGGSAGHRTVAVDVGLERAARGALEVASTASAVRPRLGPARIVSSSASLSVLTPCRSRRSRATRPAARGPVPAAASRAAAVPCEGAPAPAAGRVSPRSFACSCPWGNSWGPLPAGSSSLPRTARQKKSAHSAREFLPFRPPVGRQAAGWTVGEGQGVGVT